MNDCIWLISRIKNSFNDKKIKQKLFKKDKKRFKKLKNVLKSNKRVKKN